MVYDLSFKQPVNDMGIKISVLLLIEGIILSKSTKV